MNVASPKRVSFGDYLVGESAGEVKHEWCDGVVYAMSRGTPIASESPSMRCTDKRTNTEQGTGTGTRNEESMREAAFHDLERVDDPRNGSFVRDLSTVADLVESLREREPFFFELRGDDGLTLTIGLSREWACVQQAQDDEPPYLVALGANGGSASPVSFLAGGTPTPVHGKHCLSQLELLAVLRSFLAGTDLGSAATWEEV